VRSTLGCFPLRGFQRGFGLLSAFLNPTSLGRFPRAFPPLLWREILGASLPAIAPDFGLPFAGSESQNKFDRTLIYA
jgi:hypothetical protein